MSQQNRSLGNFTLKNHCYINTNESNDRFVGIKVENGDYKIFFPIGYDLPNDEIELRRDIKNLLMLISEFTDRTERIMAIDSLESSQLVNLPLQAYFYILNRFVKNNCKYYIEKVIDYKTSSKGKTNWAKTIKKQKPLIQKKSFFYLKQIVKSSKGDQDQMITQIHKYLVFESFERLGWLFSLNRPESSPIKFEKNNFLSVINSKLQHTNNDEEKKLFIAMKRIVESCGGETKNKKLFFGTDRFEIIWEKLIDKFFGITNKNDYFPHAIWKERYGNNTIKRSSALEPDTIMILDDNIYVLDAKYYRYGTHSSLNSNYLPHSSDVNKQITYGEYVNKNKTLSGNVYNAFILPYNKNENQFGENKNFLNVAEAVGDWLDNSSQSHAYKRIQAIVVDTRFMLNNYKGSHYLEKLRLKEEIERFF